MLVDEPDRSVFILAAAFFEEDLDRMLRCVIQSNSVSNKSIKAMFDLNGPLSNFASKTLVAHAFGMISNKVFDDLNGIRKLRNRCAHSYETVDFIDKNVEDAIFNLNCCQVAADEWKAKGYCRYDVNGKDRKQLDEYLLREQGLVKYGKAIFCSGVQILQISMILHSIKKTCNLTDEDLAKHFPKSYCF